MNIEPLELRIAPASVFAFTDIDGDKVKITSSAGDLNAAGVATFSGGTGGQLQLLDIGDAAFDGASIIFTVTQSGGGDGLAAVGFLNGGSNDFGAITIKGDLSAMFLGSGSATVPAVKSLSVRSLGVYGTATQIGGSGNLESTIHGGVGKLTVTGDVKDAFLSVTTGNIGAVSIGGSLLGGNITAVDGGLGGVKIKGGILGGNAPTSGAVVAKLDIKSVSVGGSLVGGAGASSGTILSSTGALGPVKIGGNITSGDGTLSGRIFAKTKLTSASVGGSVIGTASGNGGIGSEGDIGMVSIAHNLGKNGSVGAGGKITALRIGGSVDGGSVTSGGDMVAVTIRGDVAANTFGGRITSGGKLSKIVVGGSLIGVDSASGLISGNEIGTLKIGNDVIGGDGDTSGGIFSDLGIASINIGGSVLGATRFSLFALTGFIQSGGDIGSIKIGGDVRGGLGNSSGFIGCGGALSKVSIGGSVGGGNGGGGFIFVNGDIGSVVLGGSLLGGNGSQSGFISSTTGDIGSVKIGGDLRGGNLLSGATQNVDRSGYIEGSHIGSVFIGGSIIAGRDDNTNAVLTRNASIRARDDIGAIVIRGSVIGNFGNGMTGNLASVVISARGQETLAPGATADLAIKSVSIGGSVALAKILGGFDPDDTDTAGSNGNASIGTVKVGGDLFASSVSAGVNAGNFGFGSGGGVINNATDAIVARIVSITIRGSVTGAPNPFFQCGFTAQQIGAFKAAGFTAPLTAGTDAPIVLTPFTGNETLREV